MFTPPYSQLAREHTVSVPQGGPVYREGQTVVFRCTARASGPRSHDAPRICAAAKDIEAKL